MENTGAAPMLADRTHAELAEAHIRDTQPTKRTKDTETSQQVASRPKKDLKQLGAKGEDIACIYLSDNNIHILERNWKCRAGEADIIVREGEDLAFIEVKTRSSIATGFPEDAITPQKRNKYERIALQYLAAHQHPSSRVRFDVIAVVLTGEKQAMLRHHRDAFSIE